MLKPKGVFIFVDDDTDEHEMFRLALAKICDSEIKFAANGEEGLKQVREHKDNTFMIISDINMPRINGLEFKRVIEGTPELKLRAIPFIFHSTHDNPIVVKEAYSLGIQGFVKKGDDLTQSVAHLEMLVTLWSNIVHPNSFLP
jgi:CheY-like chemotaxis protein